MTQIVSERVLMIYAYPRTIYAIQHNETGRIYVGNTSKLTRRIGDHMWQLKSGKHCNKEMQKDYDEYGDDYSVYVLDKIEDGSQKIKEMEWMEKLGTYDVRVGYNHNDPWFRRKRPREVKITEGIPVPNEVWSEEE